MGTAPISRRAARESASTRPRSSKTSPTVDPATGAPIAATEPKGIAALVRKHPTAWLASALAVAFLVLGTGAVFAGAALGGGAPEVEASSAAVADTSRAVPEELPASMRLRTCSIAALASDPRLMSLKGYVMNAATGDVLFSREGEVPNRTGSVMKVLTAAAAISALGPDYQLSTRVFAGSSESTVVLVGGGDPTLSALPAGAESVYGGAPKLSDLAAQVNAAHSGPITDIVLDATYWSVADKWDSSWKRSEQTIGYHSEVTALMVDGDRSDPARATSPRSTDPVMRAGRAFAEALGYPDATLTLGAATGTAMLGEVKSQPVKTLIGQMLPSSDNTLAEMLARVVSKQAGLNGSAASLQQAIPGALDGYGVDVAGLVIRDGSGLSDLNAVPPKFVAELMVKINEGGQNLNIVFNSLPVSGQSGSLAGRFTGANAIARGAVTAKTGWIDTAYTLGGVVRAQDGSTLTFAFYAIGDGIRDNARAAIDTLTTGVFSCGDNLSNN